MRTIVCDMLGIDVPIFAFTHCRDVVVEVSKAGGLGVLGMVGFTPEQVKEELDWIDAHIGDKPYGVDIVIPQKYEGMGATDPKDLERQLKQAVPQGHFDFAEKLLNDHGVPAWPDDSEMGLLGWTEASARPQLEEALRHPKVRLVANALGTPPAEVIAEIKASGRLVAALCGKIKQGLRHKAAGVDIVIAQGHEGGGHTGEIGSVVLRPDAEPPLSKLIILREIEPRFEASWLHKRPDLKDGSESGYDLAVANYAAQAEWTDQEIADLIIARRRNCQADVTKALRLDYIRDRIRHARVSVAAARVAADVQVREDIKAVEQEQTLTEMDATVERGSTSTEILAYLSDMFGLQIVRWTQATRHQAFYELHLADRMVIAIGEVEAVTNQKRFQNAVYAHAGKLIGPFKPDDWSRILRALSSVVEVSDSGTSSRTGQLLEWLDMYAGPRALDLTEYDFHTLTRNQPFRKGGNLYVHAGDFAKWLGFQNVKITKSELLATLRLVGFDLASVRARDESGGQVGRCYWTIAAETLAEAAGDRGTTGNTERHTGIIPAK